jgi:hypothetical protein
VTIRLESTIAKGSLCRGIFSHNEAKDRLQIDFSIPFSSTDRFTIFWRGLVHHDDLTTFMSELYKPPQLLATLFFSPKHSCDCLRGMFEQFRLLLRRPL